MQYNLVSTNSRVRQNASSLSGIRIKRCHLVEKALKETEIVFLLTGISINRIHNNEVLLYGLGRRNNTLMNEIPEYESFDLRIQNSHSITNAVN